MLNFCSRNTKGLRSPQLQQQVELLGMLLPAPAVLLLPESAGLLLPAPAGLVRVASDFSRILDLIFDPTRDFQLSAMYCVKKKIDTQKIGPN